MLVLIHVIIAVISCIYTSYIYFSPSKKKISFSYFLIASTLGTGTYLTITMPSHMVQSCVMGIFYVCFVAAITISAHRKIAHSKISE